jgi:Zn-dependent peptidase ImmA (M78 family)
VSQGTFQNLKDLRERLLGYQFDTVVRQTKVTRERLHAIEEEGAAPTVFELYELGRLYGVDDDLLFEEPIRLAPGDAVEVLARLDEFKEIDDYLRMRIVAVANAAREWIRLRRVESPVDPRLAFAHEAPRLERPSRSLSPHRQGAQLATALRRAFGLRSEPIPSLRDFVAERLPSIGLLYAELGAHGPAGLSFADPLRGPTIVLNLEGKNANPCVRRFSLAHEVCHLLVDWNRHESLAVVSGFLSESGLERERRANAFAVRFLCPEGVIRRIRPESSPVEAARILGEYGLPYAAIRMYLRNEASRDLPAVPSPELQAVGTQTVWALAEEPTGIASFPLKRVPPERRTIVALAAARLHAAGKTSRASFAESMDVTPVDEVEQVLDFFAMDRPEPRA